jgi:HK97 family phage portal protein
MGVFDNIFKRLGYAPSAPVDPYSLIVPAKAQPITEAPAFLRADASAEQYSIPDRSLPEAQLELYQRLSWVQIAVSKVAEVGASTAFNVMALQGEDTNDIPNHPFELLLRRPNPLHSRAEFIEGTLIDFCLTGNAYWWLNKVGNTVAELWLLPPHKVRPVPDGRMFLRGYLYDIGDGNPIPLELGEVVHFRRFHPLNSFVGLSPIEALAVVATGDMAAQRWNTNFFDKNNAKIPGMLAFADPINDEDWNKIKSNVKEEYGGTKRSLMLLRGAGQGGVQWISTAMSQGDMQFLEGRTFTKEEIFAIYAPGLSSMLAVNATEANSVSGKRTFIEYGVWPHLVRLAEKITNDLLPLYGPNLVGEFEDIRVTDKQMELSEIAAYSQTHTVDEVRARYYQDDPLGDDRGNLLVPEIGKGLTPADPNPEPPPAPIIMGQPGQMVPAKPDQTQQDQADQEDTNDAQDMPDMGQMQAEGRQGETGRQQEVKALRRWLRNRGDKADPLKFRRVHLSADDVLDIAGDMGIDAGQEADTEHPPFAWMTGRLTRDGWLAVKALQLQLDPGEDDAAERVITELERRGEAAILRAFREQWRDLLPPNAENMELGELMAYINSRLLTAQPTQDAIARTLYDAAGAGVNIALDQLERIGVGFDYTLVNTRAQDWAKRYSGELITNINDTTKQAVQQAVERWYGNGEPLSALIDDLQPAFSKKRARLIAQTETTRAASQGTYAGLKESGVVTGVKFKTANDEKVCPWCGSLDGKIISIDGGAFYDELSPELQSKLKRRFDLPPVHPNCRCRISGLVKEI